jgi:hypothetical protein
MEYDSIRSLILQSASESHLQFINCAQICKSVTGLNV